MSSTAIHTAAVVAAAAAAMSASAIHCGGDKDDEKKNEVVVTARDLLVLGVIESSLPPNYSLLPSLCHYFYFPQSLPSSLPRSHTWQGCIGGPFDWGKYFEIIGEGACASLSGVCVDACVRASKYMRL